MTTSVTAERTPRGARVGRSSGEALVFTVATAVGLVHALDVGHTAAIRQAAPEYERRVTAFFDEALTGR